MKLLDRYVVSEIVPPFFFGISAFATLLLAGEALYQLTKMVVEKGVPLWQAMELLALRFPAVLVLTFPMSMLLACLLGFNRLSGDSEVVAMRAGGVAFYRVAYPVFWVALFVSGLTILCNEKLVPMATRASQKLEADITQIALTKSKTGILLREPTVGPLRRIIHADHYDEVTDSLLHVEVFEYDQDQLRAVVKADHAVWQGNQWRFWNGFVQTIGGSKGTLVVPFGQIDRTLGKTPEQIQKESSKPDPDNMTAGQIKEYIRVLKQSGVTYTVRFLEVELQNKFALPFASLIFAMLGTPLGLRKQRSSSSVGLGISVVIIFIYYVVWHYTSVLGYSGHLSPVVASWFANFWAFVTGLILILRAGR